MSLNKTFIVSDHNAHIVFQPKAHYDQKLTIIQGSIVVQISDDLLRAAFAMLNTEEYKVIEQGTETDPLPF